MDHFGRILTEVLGVFITLGWLFIHGMPAIATALSIIFNLVCIIERVRHWRMRDK